jgi:hypothetical protein
MAGGVARRGGTGPRQVPARAFLGSFRPTIETAALRRPPCTGAAPILSFASVGDAPPGRSPALQGREHTVPALAAREEDFQALDAGVGNPSSVQKSLAISSSDLLPYAPAKTIPAPSATQPPPWPCRRVRRSRTKHRSRRMHPPRGLQTGWRITQLSRGEGLAPAPPHGQSRRDPGLRRRARLNGHDRSITVG